MTAGHGFVAFLCAMLRSGFYTAHYFDLMFALRYNLCDHFSAILARLETFAFAEMSTGHYAGAIHFTFIYIWIFRASNFH